MKACLWNAEWAVHVNSWKIWLDSFIPHQGPNIGGGLIFSLFAHIFTVIRDESSEILNGLLCIRFPCYWFQSHHQYCDNLQKLLLMILCHVHGFAVIFYLQSCWLQTCQMRHWVSITPSMKFRYLLYESPLPTTQDWPSFQLQTLNRI